MSCCRVCLTDVIKLEKDISQLPEALKEIKTHSDIMMFCLNIEVLSSSNLTTKLCDSCYTKIIEYYQFKLLALKNDEYLKSNLNNFGKSNYILSENIKSEDDSYDYDIFNDEPDIEVEFKSELDIEEKREGKELLDLESDDELLSVIKRIKYEYIDLSSNGQEQFYDNDKINEESKENTPGKRKTPKKNVLKKLEKPVCEVCGKTVNDIKNHMYLHETTLDNRKKYDCKLCDKKFATTRGRKRHHKIKHLGIKSHCDICNKDVIHLKTHILMRHETESLRFTCLMCDRRFMTNSQLSSHILSHTKDKNHKCELCQKAFRDKSTLLLHKRRVHDREKSHLCQVCSKSFFKKYHLQVHLRSHTKEKPYKCDECGKNFTSCTILKNHKEIHTDVKSHACQLCDMRFTKASYLRVHMISHTKERKYPCQYCGVKFTRSDHRARHQRTAHERHLLAANVSRPAVATAD